MPHLRRSRAPLFLLSVLPLAACSESSPSGPAAGSEPWTVQFMFGNTSVNTGEILTHQDGISTDILSDYVVASSLPDTDLELFITHVYLPTDVGIQTRVSGLSVRAARTDGSQTPEMSRGSTFVQTSTLGGRSYDVHRLEGLFVGTPALRPASFANVNFRFDVEYLGSTGSVLHASRKTVEIYKR